MIIENQKLIKCDKDTYKINDYVKLIKEYIEKIKDSNNNSIDFLIELKYNQCKKCGNNENEYFCEKCNINICDNCYINCEEEKHNLLNLDEIRENNAKYIENIKKILWFNIIPIKEEKIVQNNEKFKEENTLNIENIDDSFDKNYLDNEIGRNNYEDIF